MTWQEMIIEDPERYIAMKKTQCLKCVWRELKANESSANADDIFCMYADRNYKCRTVENGKVIRVNVDPCPYFIKRSNEAEW